MSPAERIQLIIALATLPVALLFIALYGRPSERWWRSWFGISLMTIAVAVTLYTLSVVFFRLWGPDYWGRDYMLVGSTSLTFIAMSMRTLVLAAAQLGDRPFHPKARTRR